MTHGERALLGWVVGLCIANTVVIVLMLLGVSS